MGNTQDTKPKPKFLWLKITLYCLLVCSVLVLLFQAVDLYLVINHANEQAVAIGENQANEILEQLQRILQKIENQTKSFAADLQSGKVNADNLFEHLRKESLQDSYVLGFTVAYAPNVFNVEKRLFAPFYDAAAEKVVQCEDYYDYTDKNNWADAVWYLKPVENGKAMWVTGFGPAAGTTYAGYSVPVYKQENGQKELFALVNAALSLEKLSTLLNTQYVGRLGTSIMIDERGALIVHPNTKLLNSKKTWLEIMKEKDVGNASIYKLPGLMGNGEAGKTRFRNFRGFDPPQHGWFFYRPVPGTTWSFGVAIFESELYRDGTSLRRRKILIALNVLFFLCLLPSLFIQFGKIDDRSLSMVVVAFTLGGIAVIGYLWYLNVNKSYHQRKSNPNQKTINDLNGLKVFLKEQQQYAKNIRQPPPHFVPTRIYVRSIEFEGSHNVKISGQIWQTYDKGKQDDLTRGFVFPDIAPDAEAFFAEKNFHELKDGKETIGWRFRATLRQKFTFSQYPFDSQRVSLRLKHVDEAKNVILIPDILSYRYINTFARPGLHSGISIPGWKPRGTYFSYEFVRYDLAFGNPGTSDLGQFPELQYSILLQRSFITPFISYIVPILIVTFLLYGVVIMSSLNQEKQSESGFNVFGVLGTCGAFFFTIALMHVDLRSKLNLEVVTYLESLYIISYILLVTVSLNALLFITTDAVAIIEYRDNVIAKLLYWPLFVAMVLGVTLMTFY